MSPVIVRSKSIIKEARDLARMSPPSDAAEAMLQLADELHQAYDILKIELSQEAAIEFNSAYTRLHNWLAAFKRPTVPPSGTTVSKREPTEPLLDAGVSVG